MKLKTNNSDTSKLLNLLNSFEQKQSYDDDRYWKPTVDKVGNGSAIIRFLPAPDGEEYPLVKYFDHAFQLERTKSWYIEKSLTSLGKPDPVGEYNSKLWNSGVESDKDLARKQKRNQRFVSNIYIIEDPANKENEGKVFLYTYGKKIFDKIKEALSPQFEDEISFNPFDLVSGANFKLRIKNFEGRRNYDSSKFDSPNPLFKDEEKLEAIWKKAYSLSEIVDPSKFKSYDELKERLNKVLGIDNNSVKANNFASHQTEEPIQRFNNNADNNIDDDDEIDFESLLK